MTGTVFFTLEPKLLCSSPSQLETWTECTRAAACALESDNYRIDYEHPETIRNFVTELDLLCVPDYESKVSNLGGFMLVGSVLSVVFLDPLADIYGRWPLLYASTVINFIA